jgi:hypothetical protein
MCLAKWRVNLFRRFLYVSLKDSYSWRGCMDCFGTSLPSDTAWRWLEGHSFVRMYPTSFGSKSKMEHHLRRSQESFGGMSWIPKLFSLQTPMGYIFRWTRCLYCQWTLLFLLCGPISGRVRVPNSRSPPYYSNYCTDIVNKQVLVRYSVIVTKWKSCAN